MSPEAKQLARWISTVHCPECGEVGHPAVMGVTNFRGTLVVLPQYQCDTPGCTYNHFTDAAWTPVSSN